MADPFKAAAGRAASKRSMRTSIKYDENGPYYDVNVSGGGGDAPVTAAVPASRAAVGGAPPTVLDPQRDYGPPLPPGSVGYGDEEGPIQDDGSDEFDRVSGQNLSPEEEGRIADASDEESASEDADEGYQEEPNYQEDDSDPQVAAARRAIASMYGPESRTDIVPADEQGGFGASPDEEVWGNASDEDETLPGAMDSGPGPVGAYGLPGDVVAQEDPTLMERIRRWIGSQGADVQPASQDVSEGLNEALPRDLSGRDAVLRKRKQLQQLDEDTKDS